MASRQVKVRGRRRAPAAEVAAVPAGPSGTAAAKAVVRPKRRPKAVSALFRLPLELLEHIFVLSENMSLPRAHPVLGQRLSGRSTLIEFVVAVFGLTWASAVGDVVDVDDADEVGDAALQSEMLACAWATPALLLAAEQRWQGRRGLHHYPHSFYVKRAWLGAAPLLNRRHVQALSAAHRSKSFWGCQTRDAGMPADEEEGEASTPWPDSLYTCHALEQATFFELLHAVCQDGGEENKEQIGFLFESIRRNYVRVRPLTRVPEQVLLAGGPFPAPDRPGQAGQAGQADEIHRRLYDAFDRLFWLAVGRAELQRSDSWEVTYEGFQNLLGLGPALEGLAGPGAASAPADVYSTQAVAAGMVVLFHIVGVFTDQWPATVVEAAETAVRARAGADASFQQSMLCTVCMLVFEDLRLRPRRAVQTGRR